MRISTLQWRVAPTCRIYRKPMQQWRPSMAKSKIKKIYKHAEKLLLFSHCVRLLRPHGLEPTRLLCPGDFPGKNTGVGCHFLLQEIVSTQRLNSCPLLGRFFTTKPPDKPTENLLTVKPMSSWESAIVSILWFLLDHLPSCLSSLLSSFPIHSSFQPASLIVFNSLLLEQF